MLVGNENATEHDGRDRGNRDQSGDHGAKLTRDPVPGVGQFSVQTAPGRLNVCGVGLVSDERVLAHAARTPTPDRSGGCPA